ncbi:MAG TPA: hypothetical protein VGK96_28315 [Candidatus Sulfotelmatobacter sp.]
MRAITTYQVEQKFRNRGWIKCWFAEFKLLKTARQLMVDVKNKREEGMAYRIVKLTREVIE